VAWLHAPVLADLNSDSSSPSETPTALWCTSSGKPTLRPYSWRGWNTRPWIRLLSGTISRPSTAARGVESWISSLRDSRVSHAALSASDEAPTILHGYGPTSPESLPSPDRPWFSSRIPPDCVFSPYSATFAASGSMRRGTVSALPREEPRIGVKGCSYLPTPTASTYGSNVGGAAGRVGDRRASLREIAGGPESPEWLEWLMGLPIGHSDIEPLGTQWSRWWQLMRSELSRLGWG
jgi:hypothetical protein